MIELNLTPKHQYSIVNIAESLVILKTDTESDVLDLCPSDDRVHINSIKHSVSTSKHNFIHKTKSKKKVHIKNQAM